MHTTPTLQAIVTQLACRHDIDLQQTGAYLRLQHPQHGHLVLENIGADRVSVSNYVAVMGDWLSDPEIVLYTEYRSASQSVPAWVPLESTQFSSGWRLAAELDQGGALLVHDPALQAELAVFCERVVAHELQRQNWLSEGVPANVARPSWTNEEIRARDIRPDEVPSDAPRRSRKRGASQDWPAPTVEEPNLETLEEWLWADGGCEASDGCWTDPDGHCPHGHPSWLLRLGFI